MILNRKQRELSKWWLILILGLGMMVALVACNADEPADTSEAEEGKQEEEPVSETPDPTGGVLRLASIASPTALGIPWELRSTYDFFISSPALEKLGRYTAAGTSEPHLAERWEENPEEKTITYYLRKGIQFHDGTPFNAEAVKWNLDNFLQSGRAELNGIESVSVVDEYTVQVKLESWMSSMLNNINHFLPIISPSSYEKMGRDEALKHPVGTGPFQFDQWIPDERIAFKRFDQYWQEGKPYLDAIEFVLYADSTTASVSMQAGEVDGFISTPPMEAHKLNQLPNITVLNLETGLGSLAQGVIFDTGNPDSVFQDVNVRKAVAYAIDREAIVDSLLYGYGIPSNQWGTPGSPTFNEQLDIGYDPERAKALLAEAGYGDGIKITFSATNDPETQQRATAIKGYLENVGFEVELNLMDDALFRELTSAAPNKPWEGLMQYNFRGDWDLATYMPRNFSPQGTTYAHNIIHPEDIQELFPKIRAARTPEEMKEVAYELQRLVFEEHALAVSIYVGSNPVAMYEHVQDTGINEGHASEWKPENAKLNK